MTGLQQTDSPQTGSALTGPAQTGPAGSSLSAPPQNNARAPADQEARRRAIDPTTSFAVSAPAGSGKTGLLTQRVLTLLAGVDYPEEILAITFTRKAAGEMQDRIIHALQAAASSAAPSDPHQLTTWTLAQAALARDAACEWGLMHNPQRLRVTTIDSLCRNITQQMPLASAMGAQPQLLDNPQEAYLLAVRELFIQTAPKDLLYTHLARLLRHLDNDMQKIETLLSTLLAQRDQWLQAVLGMRYHDAAKDYFEAVIGDIVSEHLALTHASFAPLASEFCRLADLAGQTLKNDGVFTNPIAQLAGISALPGSRAEDLDLWQIISHLLLTGDNQYRKTFNKNQGFVAGKEGKAAKDAMLELIGQLPELAPALQDQLAWVKTLPSANFSEGQWAILESLGYVLPHLSAQLLVVFKQLGATDFIQISQAALTALGDDDTPTDLALQLDYKIKHILIDEFQDTASTQLHLIEKLTQGWQPGDGRSLFIVGDGMQSCYGFRNAKVGIFLDARRSGIGSTPLTCADLQVNFRSQAGVVDWVNRVFSRAFPAQDEIARGAVKYAPSIAFKPTTHEAAVTTYIHTYSGDTDGAQLVDAERAEAAQVAQLVQDNLAAAPNQKIAILVKSRPHLKHLVPALGALGISFQATNIDSLSARTSISDLRSLAKALLDSSDRIAWLALLRSPLVGLELRDLHELVNCHLPDNPALGESFAPIFGQLMGAAQTLSSDYARARLGQVLPLLTHAFENRQRRRLSSWIEGVWLALGGPAGLSDSNELNDCQQFFNLLERFAVAGNIVDWQGFDAALAQLYAAPQADADARVQIMTIHKSKGLEFDTVIIPQLHKAGKSDANELLLLHEHLSRSGESQLLLSCVNAVGAAEDPIYSFIKEEHKKQKDYEATRLLYVGCTRAIHKLILTGCLSRTQDGLANPSKQSLLSKIWPEICDQVELIEASPSTASASLTSLAAQTTGAPLTRLAQNALVPPFPHQELLPGLHINANNPDPSGDPLNRPVFDTAPNRLARHIGTLIHAALETLVRQAALRAQAPEAICAHLEPLWEQQLRIYGWGAASLDAALLKIRTAVSGVLQSSTGQWLLDHTHTDSAVELGFARPDAQGIREFSVDRSFIAEGVRWIIDYKTAEPQTSETITDFFTREMALYRPQLLNYAKLFASAKEALPIKTAVYFVLLDRLVHTDEYPALAEDRASGD